MPTDEQRAADLARAFHEAYERLAPSFGYETRRESAAPWESVPDQNRALMTAVCAEVMAPLLASRKAAAEDREQARTQTAVLACLERLVGKDRVRGGDGCDSGDPLDWTLAAISLTVTRWVEEREAAARAGAVEEAAGECERDAMGWMEEYRAAEIEAAKDAIPGHPGLGAELARCECRSVRSALLDAAARIRIALAATPPDRVVVAVSDAEMAATALDLTAARWAHDEADPMPGAAQMAEAAAARIRAALARLGESDGR